MNSSNSKEERMKKRNFRKLLLVFLLICVISAPQLSAQGHFEFNFHYGRWSLNLLGNTIENILSDALETEFKDAFLEEIQQDYPYLTDPIYSQTVDFDSGGYNYGFEVRWYPGGYNGSFSLGLSLEKTRMEVELAEVSADMEFNDGSTFGGITAGDVVLNPTTFHLSFRWDIIPTSRIHPYITFGVGAATFSSIESDEVHYSWSGELDVTGGPEESYGPEEETKTIKQIQDELEQEDEDFLSLPFLPFIQLNLGLKAKITDSIHFMVDAGVWNGFILRGGLAIRL
jgi:hypothetical protein